MTPARPGRVLRRRPEEPGAIIERDTASRGSRGDEILIEVAIDIGEFGRIDAERYVDDWQADGLIRATLRLSRGGADRECATEHTAHGKRCISDKRGVYAILLRLRSMRPGDGRH